MEFGSVTDKVVSRLEGILGSEGVYPAVADTLPYARDNCPYKWSERFRFRPDVVVTPENKEQVTEIVKLANAERIPITPKGGGTGMSGGCVPKYGGISLDSRKMDKILEANEDDLYVVVQPGITNLALSTQLAAKGYLGPHEPGSAPSSVIGGAISTSGVNYYQGVIGALIDTVMGLEVVLASGDIIRAGRNSGSTRISKSSVGLDLCHLFVGDFGSLGVKVEATLKIVPLPEVHEIHVLVFPDFVSTVEAIRHIQRTRLPGIFTFTAFDRQYMEKARTIYDSEVYGGALLIGFMGEEAIVNHVRSRSLAIAGELGGQDLGPDHAAAEWKNRFDVYPAMIPSGETGPARWHYEDPTVPVSKLAETLRRYHETVARYGFDDWGGEAWIYDQTSTLAAIMYGVDEHDEEGWDRLMECANEMLKVGLEMGGSLSNCLGFDKRGVGRHGIEYLRAEYTQAELDTMLSIKRALDPNGIMNPGTMGFDILWPQKVVA